MTHTLYIHSRKWKRRPWAILEARANVYDEPSKRTIFGCMGAADDWLEGLKEGDKVSVGRFGYGGERMLFQGRVIRCEPTASPAGSVQMEVSIECGVCRHLGVHPQEIARRAAEAEEQQRMRAEYPVTLVASYQNMSRQIAEDARGPSSNVSEVVRNDFAERLYNLCDEDDRSEEIETILEMITTRIGMAREGL